MSEKLSVVSLFSGGGGLDLGFKKEGFDIIWANDFDRDTVKTYKVNLGDHIVYKSIDDVEMSEIPSSDIIIGGPPCQSFSLVGRRNVEDDRGKLVWKFLDIIKVKQPKIFVFENVTGLKSAKTPEGTYVLNDLITAFNTLGYEIKWKILNAADYGVPQRRKRLFIVGYKDKYKFDFPEPTHSEQEDLLLRKWISVDDALNDLGKPDLEGEVEYRTKPQNSYQLELRKHNPKKYVTEHIIPTMSELDKEIISHIRVGGNYMDVPDHVPSKRIKRFKQTGGRTTCYGRLSPNQPAYTINTFFNRPNVGCNIHYVEKRLITIREAMRLQSFPDDYILDSKTKRAKHSVVGNAVPPLLGAAIAKSVLSSLLK